MSTNKKRTFIVAGVLSAIFALVGIGIAGAAPAPADQQDSVLQKEGVAQPPAVAVVTTPTGSFTEHQAYATQDVAWIVPAAVAPNTWVTVPGLIRSVTVPAGTSRLIEANATTEGQCVGGSWCSARLIVVNAAGVISELAPASGLDFALNSPGGSTWKGVAMSRVTPLPPE